MSYSHQGYNSARIPAFTKYSEVKEYYQSVNPIRGRVPEIRPLGKNRRFTWYTINEKHTVLPETDGDPLGKFTVSYSYRCWDTDLVEFFHNGDVLVRNSKWHSPTTMGFLTYSLAGIGQILSKRGKWYFQNKKGGTFLIDSEMLLRADENGIFQPTANAIEKRYRMSRKAMNTIRKKYKSFIEYGTNILRIDNTVTRLQVAEAGHGLSFENTHLVPYYGWGENANKDTTNRDLLFQALDKFNATGDLELAYELFSFVAQSAGRYSYNAQKIVCEPQTFSNHFTEVMKYMFAKELFVEEVVEQGVMFHDDNLKYVARSKK